MLNELLSTAVLPAVSGAALRAVVHAVDAGQVMSEFAMPVIWPVSFVLKRGVKARSADAVAVSSRVSTAASATIRGTFSSIGVRSILRRG
jgi:hypothetical protein